MNVDEDSRFLLNKGSVYQIKRPYTSYPNIHKFPQYATNSYGVIPCSYADI